ncbi:hypothetical protein ACET3Z_011530 [Daucus carota]
MSTSGSTTVTATLAAKGKHKKLELHILEISDMNRKDMSTNNENVSEGSYHHHQSSVPNSGVDKMIDVHKATGK